MANESRLCGFVCFRAPRSRCKTKPPESRLAPSEPAGCDFAALSFADFFGRAKKSAKEVERLGGSTRGGVIAVDVSRDAGPPNGVPGVVFRYQDQNNYYGVVASPSTLSIVKTVNGTQTMEASCGIPGGMAAGETYRLQVTAEGRQIAVHWNGQPMVSWTDTENPWLSGKVGCRSCAPSGAACEPAYWDNITVSMGNADDS